MCGVRALLENGTLPFIKWPFLLSVCFSGDWGWLWCLLLNVGWGCAYLSRLLQELVSSHCEFNQRNLNCKNKEMNLVHRQKYISSFILWMIGSFFVSVVLLILFQDARKFGARIRTALHDLLQLLSPNPKEPSKTEASRAEAKKDR